jgi:hypothetical protein
MDRKKRDLKSNKDKRRERRGKNQFAYYRVQFQLQSLFFSYELTFRINGYKTAECQTKLFKNF